MNVSTNSEWYPYSKVIDGFYDLSDAITLPRTICNYLLDAPQGSYTPQDNNALSRCRMWKYLFYDGARPLENTLPTITEKLSVVFNPKAPTMPPTNRGYRLIPQIFAPQAQTEAQTRINVYLGRAVPIDDFRLSISVIFDIWQHYTYELNTQTDVYSRGLAIEQSLIQAFHGVNMAGVGTFFFDRAKHPDCGSKAISDGETNIGRRLTVALEIATTTPNGSFDMDNAPLMPGSNNLHFI